jgi:hypothetical protein
MDDEPREADEDASGDEGGDRALSAARLRGRRAALALFTVVAVAFIVSSTTQITRALFGMGLEPLPAGAAPGSPEQLCASGIQGLARALDRAGNRLSPVASAANDADTMAALRPGLSPEWDRADEVRAACDAARGGPSAWAALERLRVAEEQSGRLGREELSSVRSDVAAHLPADLR